MYVLHYTRGRDSYLRVRSKDPPNWLPLADSNDTTSPRSVTHLYRLMILTSLLPCTLADALEVSSDPPSVAVNTPDAAVCQSTELTWTGGQAPYSLRILHQDNTPLQQLGSDVTGTSAAWVANVSAGSKLVLEVDFINGEHVTRTAFSRIFTVLPGDDSCLESTFTSSSHAGELGCIASLQSLS